MALHQDAFAAGYDDDGYTSLGMAVKYAGLHGVNVTAIGKNHETLRGPGRAVATRSEQVKPRDGDFAKELSGDENVE